MHGRERLVDKMQHLCRGAWVWRSRLPMTFSTWKGDAATVGKAVGKDNAAGKVTFVSHLGLDGAKRRAAELVQSACDALSEYGEDAETLREAARFVIARKS